MKRMVSLLLTLVLALLLAGCGGNAAAAADSAAAPRDNGSVSLETCGAPNGSRAGPYTRSGGRALPKAKLDAPKEAAAPCPPPGASSASASICIRARAASKSGPFSGERLTGFCGTTARARLSVRVRRPGVVRK